jgi:hypothetical protein
MKDYDYPSSAATVGIPEILEEALVQIAEFGLPLPSRG